MESRDKRLYNSDPEYKEMRKAQFRQYYMSDKGKANTLERGRRARERNKEFVQELKADGCQVCGEKCMPCLDFHHLDPSKKEHEPGRLSNNTWSTARILKELEKCVVLCSNCHRKVHAGFIELVVKG